MLDQRFDLLRSEPEPSHTQLRLGDCAANRALLLEGQLMASEILRTTKTNKALPPNLQAVASGISSAVSLQAKESIDHILESFTSIQEKQDAADELLGQTTVQAAGHADRSINCRSRLAMI